MTRGSDGDAGNTDLAPEDRARIAKLRAIADPQQRLEEAGRIAHSTRAFAGEVARVRHEAAAELYEGGKLSLKQLADRVGISKARADQLVKARREDDAAGKGRSDAGADDSPG